MALARQSTAYDPALQPEATNFFDRERDRLVDEISAVRPPHLTPPHPSYADCAVGRGGRRVEIEIGWDGRDAMEFGAGKTSISQC
jgi:hypothetical protein